ncbi:MAG: transposase [Deltaproteobacteria bacterium]|nr:transposase [Deltaproteobacteria bacterium]
MPRKPRVQFDGAIYHVTSRGNARQKTFLSSGDYRRFLKHLGDAVRDQDWLCHAYCLMPNHFHLLLETPLANLSKGMQQLNGLYTQWFNWRHQRVGHLFQGRFKGKLVDRDAYLLELSRYIVLNPVRAGLAEFPARWAWSSYRATVGKARRPSWLTTDWVLGQFEGPGENGSEAYERLVVGGIGARSPLKELRKTARLGGRRSTMIMPGSAAREQRLAPLIPWTEGEPPDAGDVLGAVASAFELDAASVLDRSNRDAFQAAVFLLRHWAKLPLAEIAERCGVSQPRVSQIHGKLARSGEGARILQCMGLNKGV